MSSTLYGGLDPREIPAYTLPDAAHLAGIPVPTLRSWVEGRPYPVRQGEGFFAPIIERPDLSSSLLSFVNVIEAHVLSAIRRHHQVSLPKVRRALDYARERFDTLHPLAERGFFETDGVDLFVRQFEGIVNVSRGGQFAIQGVIEAHLTRIEHDDNGRAIRLFPFVRRRDDLGLVAMISEPKFVAVDPRVSFGRPALAGTGIPTIVISDRFDAGESVTELAYDYDRPVEEIEEALRYERAAA